jgi:hypothetical protein
VIALVLQRDVVAIDLRNAAWKFQHHVHFLRSELISNASQPGLGCFFERSCPTIVRRTTNERVQILNADYSFYRCCGFI